MFRTHFTLYIMFVCYVMLMLPLIIPTNGLYKEDFCSGMNYVTLDESITDGSPLWATYDKEIKLTIYSLPGEPCIRGLTVSYEKDLRTTYRFNTLRACCYINDNTVGFVVQRQSDNTLIYRTAVGCYKLVYGYSDLFGAYIIEKGDVLCSSTEICSFSPSTVSSPMYVPQAVKTPSTSVTTYPSPLKPIIFPNPSLKPIISPSPSLKPIISPSPSLKPVSYPSIAVSSDLLAVGSDDFCLKSINYLELDAFANTGAYLDGTTWGSFKLTLYETSYSSMYDFTILDVKYVPNDIYNAREISLSKYKVCCSIYSIPRLSNVARVLPASNTLVFKIQNHDYEFNKCKSISYSYVTTSSYRMVKEITAVESVSSCRTTFFCKF